MKCEYVSGQELVIYDGGDRIGCGSVIGGGDYRECNALGGLCRMYSMRRRDIVPLRAVKPDEKQS